MSMEYAEGGAKVLPFYIVCDESGSMAPFVGSVNAALKDLHGVLASDPVVCDKAMISIITFHDTAQVLLPLTRPDDMTSIPGCTAQGGTNYSAAFHCLRAAIDSDIPALRSSGQSVLRPVAFFISDGAPTDGGTWMSAHQQLTDPSYGRRPHILSFGVADADAGVIFKVATPIDRFNGTRYAWMQEQNGDAGSVLKEIIRSLAKTIVTSVHSSQTDEPVLMPPDNIPGAIRLDEVD